MPRIQMKMADNGPKGNLGFSFKYLIDDEEFSLDRLDGTFLKQLLKRLKALSEMSTEEVMGPCNRGLRNHVIRWEDTSRKRFGIPNEDELVEKPWQISISRNNGRLHGFFIGDLFYVVWVDAAHNLYP